MTLPGSEDGGWLLQFMQNLPALAWAKDESGKYVFVNKSAAEAFGREESEILGLTDGELFDDAIAESFRRNDQLTLEKGSPLKTFEVLPDRDGIPRYSLVTKFPILAADGKIHIAGTAVDVTAPESRDLNQNVIDSIPSHIAVLDTKGEITLVNRAWQAFARDNAARSYLERTGPGMNYLSVCHDAIDSLPDAEAIHDGISKVLNREIDSFSLEYPCDEPDAEQWFQMTAHPLIGGGVVISHQEITDRRHAESNLRDVVERLALAQKAGNVGIWDWDARTKTTYWSKQMWAFYGVDEPHETHPSASFWQERLHNKDRDRVIEEVSSLLAGSETEYRAEFRIIREDGETRWIESSATVERNDDGSPRRMYGVNLDITERKLIEERLRSSEAQLRLVTDSIPALLSYIGRDGIYKFVNRRYTEWFGLQENEIVGHHMREILGQTAADALVPHLHKVLDGQRVNVERWIDYKGAGRKFVNIAYVPDLRNDGEVPGFYALVSDFTEQRLSEERLRFSEERTKTLTESFTDYAIISLDLAGRIESWNSGAVNIFGYTEGEILGTSGERLFTPEDIAKGVPRSEMNKAKEFGRASDERWHLRKDGSRFFASGVMVPLLADGELTGFAKIATDLTEKRRQTEELQTAYEEMENRVLHRTQELRAANASLLEQINVRRSEELQRIRLLQRIVTSQEDERRRIARDLHDQLGQRLTALRLKLASLRDLCVGMPEIYSRTTRLQQIAELLDSEVGFLTWQIRPAALDELGLVAALETFVVEWSNHYSKPADFHSAGIQDLRLVPEVETQIYRITQEAMNNVIKHSAAARVSVILERVESTLVLIVEDDGLGFDTQSPQNNPDDKHGTGLAGMRERAELIGGEIEVESKPGTGTTIYVRVPLSARTLETD